MRRKFKLLLTTLIILFIFTEIAITILVDEDLDGNLSLSHIHLKPYQLPVKETEKKLEELQSHKVPDSLMQNYDKTGFKREYFNVRLLPDSNLGWSPSPIYKSQDGLYIYNRDGIRCDDILTEFPEKNKLRIAIFGDSYAHGDEVRIENTIGKYLQNIFNDLNIETEILNFAVSGYGMDQAFLRWELIKEKFKPDIVILGVQFENVKRHVNLLRPFYYHITEIPYSKPRFVISENKLQLIENPIKNVTKTDSIIENFDRWEFSSSEGIYNKENYESNLFYLSNSISFVSSAISQIFNEIDYYNANSDGYKITYKIIEKFGKSVKSENGIFIPLHLPVMNDFDFVTQNFLDLFYNKKFIYDDLFSSLKLEYNFVEPYEVLNEWGEKNGFEKLFMSRHYSPIANKLIAKKIFEFLKSYNPEYINKNGIN